MADTPNPPWEPTAWLREAVSERIRLMTQAVPRAALDDDMAILMQLTEASEDATREERDRWEYTCDRCGQYCPPDGVWGFATGHVELVVSGIKILVTMGLCRVCRQAEQVPMSKGG